MALAYMANASKTSMAPSSANVIKDGMVQNAMCQVEPIYLEACLCLRFCRCCLRGYVIHRSSNAIHCLVWRNLTFPLHISFCVQSEGATVSALFCSSGFCGYGPVHQKIVYDVVLVVCACRVWWSWALHPWRLRAGCKWHWCLQLWRGMVWSRVWCSRYDSLSWDLRMVPIGNLGLDFCICRAPYIPCGSMSWLGMMHWFSVCVRLWRDQALKEVVVLAHLFICPTRCRLRARAIMAMHM